MVKQTQHDEHDQSLSNAPLGNSPIAQPAGNKVPASLNYYIGEQKRPSRAEHTVSVDANYYQADASTKPGAIH
jgi:hypothetical protein